MKLLTILLFAVALVFGQSKATPAANESAKAQVKLPAISDKERAEFLLLQRDWITVQRQYEDSFKKEPTVSKFDSASQTLQKMCQEGGAQFDQKSVQCVEVPKQTATK